MAEQSVIARYGAEFLGTFLLVFTVGCNVLAGSPTWGVTSIAAVLMVSIYAMGDVSGANFNPAVSFTLGLSGKMKWSEVAVYSLVQILGGILAALCYGMLNWRIFPLSPSPGFSWWQAGMAEILYTFMLCFVVLSCAASTRNGCDAGQQFYGLAIGFVIIAGGYGGGAISGGCFNPAVAIGIDVSGAATKFGWCLAYTIFEIIGAAMASGLFRVLRPEDFDNGEAGFAAKCISEFIGTYILVLTVGLNVLAHSPAAAWSIAAALMCMIFALHDVSGAHFNPAVTTAILAAGRGKIEPLQACAYMGSQFVGGVLGAFTYALMHRGKTFGLGPVAPYPWASAFMAEMIFTFTLCIVVLSVATVKIPLSHYFGIAISTCVTAGGFAIGGVSGGSLNPAVSVGISSAELLSGGKFWPCILYMLFEVVGACTAAGVFRITHPSEYTGESLP